MAKEATVWTSEVAPGLIASGMNLATRTEVVELTSEACKAKAEAPDGSKAMRGAGITKETITG